MLNGHLLILSQPVLKADIQDFLQIFFGKLDMLLIVI